MNTSDTQCGCSNTNEPASITGMDATQSCCPASSPLQIELPPDARSFVTGRLRTPAGEVPQIAVAWSTADYLGAARVRWGIGRDRYSVAPGLYAVGTPNDRSDVLVTANYKLTFDTVRRYLAGMNLWLLVLDTRGVNVWCAAGKGTFGTEELVRRIRSTSLEKIVTHRRLILPQLGATGVAAHRVKDASGFTVLFGPIRAADIRSYIAADHKTTKEMRQVTFDWHERLVLTPNDFLYGLRYLLAVIAIYTILAGINPGGIAFGQAAAHALTGAANIGLAYFAGIVLTPLLLPFIPIRMFAFKGYAVGLLLSILLAANNMLGSGLLGTLSWVLLLPAVSSFMAMNFTGSSTFTSLSGVQKEMKLAVPVQITSAAAAAILLVVNNVL